MATPSFPDGGILWRGWNDATIELLRERHRPFLLFVTNPDPLVAPFLKAFLAAAPKNERLRDLLHAWTVPLLLQADAVPEFFAFFGAGTAFNLAVCSPDGNPLVTIDPSRGDPEQTVELVAEYLTRLKANYP